MYIESIELENFRNYEKEKVSFHRKVNMILGENAQGKTNLLESIYLMSLGKSFRTPREKEMIKMGSEFCRVKTAYKENGGEKEILEIFISKEGKKGIKKNSLKIEKISQLLDNIYVVVFSPEDMKIVKEDPEKRRSFMDREMCQMKYSYMSSLYSYKKILAQRNAYLKERKIDEDIMEVWDEQLSEAGAVLISGREDFIKKIDEISRNLNYEITEGKEKLEIKYRPSIENSENKDDLKKNIMKTLKKNRQNDLFYGNTGKGPHKDDFDIYINENEAKKYGSQGQQRTAALSIKLAETKIIEKEKKEKPILLLDDVFSELDANRQKYLINSLWDMQLFITTTEISSDIKKTLPEGKEYTVENGKVLQKAGYI